MPVNWSRLLGELLPPDSAQQPPARVQFPVLPQSLIDFSQLAENPDATTVELAQVIERDSALTMELLRSVNSAEMGLKWKVTSAARAVTAIGVRRTKTVLLTTTLQQALRGVTSKFLHPVRFHRDNAERSMFAVETARIVGGDEETCRTASMLQDLLLPSLTGACSSEYGKFDDRQGDLAAFERARFGWNHAELMARLMLSWGFPEEIIASVLLHHATEAVLDNPDLAHTAAAAVAIASLLPDAMQQMPQGIDQLLSLQDRYPRFACLEVAQRVDATFERDDAGSATSERVGLTQRLEKFALARLERSRVDSVLIDRQLGNYALEEKLGEGGMGVVYRARHCLLKRPAAVKLLQSSIDRKSIQRFESEVQLTCQLTSPNTVAVYDYGVTPQGMFYYAMEYIEGLTLGTLVRRFGPQPQARVIHLLTQACRSLQEAHELGLIHRDIKPDNLMLTRRGGVCDVVKVLDFGLACAMGSNGSGVCGTPEFLAPEAITSPESANAVSDVYALGAVGYFLLTGAYLFSVRDTVEVLKQQIRVAPPRLSTHCGADFDPILEAAIMDCLEKDPARRPGGAHDLSLRLLQSDAARGWSESDAGEWWSIYRAEQSAADSGRFAFPKSDTPLSSAVNSPSPAELEAMPTKIGMRGLSADGSTWPIPASQAQR